MKRKFRVLIVDDNVAMAQGLAELLRPTYDVREAHSGNEALRQAELFRPELILLDVELPDQSGFDVCRKLRANAAFRDLLIVHVSATRADRDDQLLGLETGANAYITLPISNRELLARVHAMMRVKEVEHALKESERRYRTLAEALPNLVWTANAEGKCDFLSHQWLEYTGATADEHLGDGWVEALHPDDRALAFLQWEQARKGECSYDLEYRLLGKDGVYRWFKTRGVPILNDDGSILQWFGTCTEISEMIEARQALQQNRTDLERRVQERTWELQETIKELEKFSYTIAHDFRAPLRAMNSFSSILVQEHEGELTDDARNYLGRIIRSAKRLDRMLTDLLLYSQLNLRQVTGETIQLESLVAETVHELAFEIKNLKAEVVVEPMSITVVADRSLLLAVLQQLISNALKFRSADGTPRISIGATRRAGLVELYVQDNGIGIDPSHHERIFRLFETLGNDDSSTGIGLAIARKCMQRLGGKVKVESEPGQGSCFKIELPSRA